MEEDSLRLNINGGEFIATRMNTTLFTFWGELAMYNHVFLELGDEEEDVMQGAYVFTDADSYLPIVEHIVEHEFPMVLNRPECPPCDRDAWAKSHIGDLNSMDSFPVEWEDEKSQ